MMCRWTAGFGPFQLFRTVCPSLCLHRTSGHPRVSLRETTCYYWSLKTRHHMSTQPTYNSLDSVRDHVVRVPVNQCGYKFDVGVVVLGNPSHPAVLFSHGVPGGAEDFLNLVPTLLNLNLRLILPTYPGYELSPLPDKDLYRLTHSTVEKADLLKQVCRHFSIESVKLMLSHSQGTAAAYKFCADENVRSAMFLAPCGEKPQHTAQPYWGLQMFAACLRTPLLEPLFTKLLLSQYKAVGFKTTAPAHLKAAIQTVASANFVKNLDYAKVLAEKKLPMVFVTAQNDRIVEYQRAMDLLGDINVPSHNIVYYDEDIKPSHQFSTDCDHDWYTRVLVCKSGGHLIHRTQQDLVTSQIKELVRFVNS